jgi:hypothetical protein
MGPGRLGRLGQAKTQETRRNAGGRFANDVSDSNGVRLSASDRIRPEEEITTATAGPHSRHFLTNSPAEWRWQIAP